MPVIPSHRRPSRFALIAVVLAAAWPGRSSAETLIGLTIGNRLVFFDSATPGTIDRNLVVTGLGGGEVLLGIDRRPANGLLYGLGSGSRLYTIDPSTAIATQVGADGSFTLSGGDFGFDFNPTVDRIRAVSNLDQNLRLNPNDGTLTATDTALQYDNTTADGDPIDPNSGANPNIVGSAYTNNFPVATTTTLFGIDATLDILVSQVPPNAGTLNTIGPLGFNTSGLVGFDISGLTGTAFASMTVTAGNFSQLFTIDLGTGSSTLVGDIGAGAPLRGLTAAIPEPSSLVLIGLGLLGMAGVARHRQGRAADDC